jgi:hypothetical protein
MTYPSVPFSFTMPSQQVTKS